MTDLILSIDGMTCDGCANAVRKALERTPGVAAAGVTLTPAQASISYDPSRTGPAALRAAIEDAGFDVRA